MSSRAKRRISSRDSSVAESALNTSEVLPQNDKMSTLRLDKYLALKFPKYSRAFLKSQIKSGSILINGKIKKPSYILKDNDKVEVNIKKGTATQLGPNPSIKLNVIYEDKNVIAIDKPAGIATHPAKPTQTDTVANALLAYYPAIEEVGDPSTSSGQAPSTGASTELSRMSSGQANLRPGIVHRLDKDTSGILIVAKNNQTFNWLKKQFAQRKVVKKYLAMVTGKIKEQQGVISKPISKKRGTIKRTTAPISGTKEAVTYYRVIKIFDDYTLTEAEPKTGRTHQIRVHLASIGHPLAGDKLYGFKNQICPPGLKRHFLHASYLKISLPDGKMVELYSELPDDLGKVLNNLRNPAN